MRSVTEPDDRRWSWRSAGTKVPRLHEEPETPFWGPSAASEQRGDHPTLCPTMSDHIEDTSVNPSAETSRRGQSLVEFALVLPMPLVLLLGIADFGRVFAAGITLEAAARNAAEAAAQEYVQRQRADAGPLTAADYDAIRAVAHRVACEEAAVLPNRTGGPVLCTMPVSAVCVHDLDVGDASDCGEASAVAPADCTMFGEPWTAALQQTEGVGPFLPYVEVRLCYRFTTLIPLSDLDFPLGWSLSVGDVWLQRDRSFVGGDY